MKERVMEGEAWDIPLAKMAMVKGVVTLDWKSVSAMTRAITRPISQTGGANPDTDIIF